MIIKSILAPVPGLQSVALVGRDYRMVPQKGYMKSKSNYGPKKFIKGYIDLTVGIGLTKATAGQINKL